MAVGVGVGGEGELARISFQGREESVGCLDRFPLSFFSDGPRRRERERLIVGRLLALSLHSFSVELK
jgi:hypothetical protein